MIKPPEEVGGMGMHSQVCVGVIEMLWGFFFPIILFIYFWLFWVFDAERRFSLVTVNGGYSLVSESELIAMASLHGL